MEAHSAALSTRTIRVKNVTHRAITVILEPWANEYTLPTGAVFDVLERGGSPDSQLEIHLEDSSLVFYGRVGSVLSIIADGEELP